MGLTTSLGKMGYNQHFPKAVVNGPFLLSCGGLNMVNLLIENGISGRANLCQHHLYAQDSISKMIRLSIRASQLESGQTEDILMYPGIKMILYLIHVNLDYNRRFMAQPHDLR